MRFFHMIALSVLGLGGISLFAVEDCDDRAVPVVHRSVTGIVRDPSSGGYPAKSDRRVSFSIPSEKPRSDEAKQSLPSDEETPMNEMHVA